MIETLFCAGGHEWTRERARGRKPATCPEHRGIERPEGQEQPAARDLLAEEADAAIDRLHDCSARRMLDFIRRDLARPNIDDGDASLMRERRREILKGLKRGIHTEPIEQWPWKQSGNAPT